MSVASEASTLRVSRHVPGEFLLRPEPLAAALLIAINDFWLKPHHPGLLSGKLSDVGLCFLFPVLLAAACEWGLKLWTLVKRSGDFAPRHGIYVASAWLAAGYFVFVKALPVGAWIHVEILAAFMPSLRFAATADPTDLVCLPLVFVAFRFLVRRSVVVPT